MVRYIISLIVFASIPAHGAEDFSGPIDNAKSFGSEPQSHDPPMWNMIRQSSPKPLAIIESADESAPDKLDELSEWNRNNVPTQNGFSHELSDEARVSFNSGTVAAQVASENIQKYQKGHLLKTADSELLWYASVFIENAYRLRLHLSQVELPRNVQMWVYSISGETVGPFGVDLLDENGNLWTPSVAGPELTLVLLIPQANTTVQKDGSNIQFTINSIVEQFKLDSSGQPITNNPEGEDLSCLMDSQCVSTSTYANIEKSESSVAYMQYMRDGGSYSCSGGLVNDRDVEGFIPYFLTANHCISTQASASSLESFWDYRTSTCGGAAPNLGSLIRVSGSTLLVTGESGDYTLLRLSSNPAAPPGGSRFYMGWSPNQSTVSPGTILHRVSHPNSMPQQYSQTRVDADGVSCTGWSRSAMIYQSILIGGSTIGGSSGSPVFTSEGRIVGHLAGSCPDNDDDSCDVSGLTVDGAFHHYWAAVRPYIDPDGEPSQSPDLVVVSPGASNTSPNEGQSFSISATVRNNGDGNAASTTLRYYRSTNSTISTSDVQLATDGVGGLSPGQTSAESASVSITSAGTYWVGACVDSVSGETNTSNNCSTGVRVEVGTQGSSDDHGDSCDEATAISRNSTTAGTVQPANDLDFFRIELSEAGTLTLETSGSLNTAGFLKNSFCGNITSDNDGGSGNQFRIQQDVSAGTYYVRVNSSGRLTSGSYQLHSSFAPSAQGDDHGGSCSTATSMNSGGSLSGTISPANDRDYFKIVLSQAGTLVLSTSGSTNTFGRLKNSNCSNIQNNNNSGSGTNFSIQRDVSAGTYYLEVTTANLATTGNYQLGSSFTPTAQGDDHGGSCSSATALNSGGSASGTISPANDRDYFRIELSQAGRLVLNTTGSTNTQGRLKNSNCSNIANNNNAGSGTNFRIQKDVPAGTYYVEVTTSNLASTGDYQLNSTFTPSAQGDDHGGSCSTATAMTSGGSVSGRISPANDRDYFRINLSQPGTLVLSTSGTTNTVGNLKNANCSNVANNNNAGSGTNFRIQKALSAGTYYVEVTTSNLATTGNYQLSSSFTPSAPADNHGGSCSSATTINSNGSINAAINPANDLDYFKFVLPQAGTLVLSTSGSTNTFGSLKDRSCFTITNNNNAGSGTNFWIRNVLSAGTYYISVNSSNMATTGDYQLNSSFTPSGPVDDHGNSCSRASYVDLNNSIAGRIDPANDLDYIQFFVPEDGTVTVRTTGSTDTLGYLKDINCSDITSDDDAGEGRNFFIERELSPGIYYIRVSSFANRTIGNYRLFVDFEQTNNISVDLDWSNNDDLDLHCIDPCGQEIYHGFRDATCQGYLGHGTFDTGQSEESIDWADGSAPGQYECWVHSYSGSGGSTSYSLWLNIGGRPESYNGALTPGQESTHYFFQSD